jgi:hypothetical protein
MLIWLRKENNMNNVKMGQVYFELNNSTETKEQLDQFFLDLGFQLVKKKPLGDELFNRVSRFTNNNGLEFDVVWFKNLAHIRLGEWGKAFIEITFTKIIGSYIPNSGHYCFDFIDVDKKTGQISVKINE